MIPDDVYVHQTVEGDTEAFNELVNRHHSKIYGLAYRMLGNSEGMPLMRHKKHF